MNHFAICTQAKMKAPIAREPGWYRMAFFTPLITGEGPLISEPFLSFGVKYQQAQAPAMMHWPSAMRKALFQSREKKAAANRSPHTAYCWGGREAQVETAASLWTTTYPRETSAQRVRTMGLLWMTGGGRKAPGVALPWMRAMDRSGLQASREGGCGIVGAWRPPQRGELRRSKTTPFYRLC